jgi:hypothetical protein
VPGCAARRPMEHPRHQGETRRRIVAHGRDLRLSPPERARVIAHRRGVIAAPRPPPIPRACSERDSRALPHSRERSRLSRSERWPSDSRYGREGAVQLQRALAARDVLAVRSLPGQLPIVPLRTAAEITLLLLEREPESYAPAARRLLARLATERALPLRHLADVAAILAELEGDPAMSPGERLISLVQGAPPPR